MVLPIEPILLALDLEARGIRLTRDGEDLLIEPWSRLTDDDLAGLRSWKPHLLAIVTYAAPELVQ